MPTRAHPAPSACNCSPACEPGLRQRTYKQWRPLQRFTGCRATYAETHQAIAGFVSDRSARRATCRKPGTERVLARQATC